MKLETHYVVNETMQPVAEKFFLATVPSGFRTVAHPLPIQTSGDFMKDNFRCVLEERTRLIIEQIKGNIDGGLMFWCDIDVIFFSDCSEMIIQQAAQYELLFQREHARSDAANFGLQVVRRNAATLRFYRQLLDRQRASQDGHLARVGNELLRDVGNPRWGLLPITFASESNGGFNPDSLLYHANGTPTNSIQRKYSRLESARIKERKQFMGFKCKKKGHLITEIFKGYETRNESTIQMIDWAIQNHKTPDFNWVYVYTGDRRASLDYLGRPLLCYASDTDNFDNVCPDFVFDHWRQTNLHDYERVREEITVAGARPPETDMAGWRGNVTTHPSRKNIIKLDDKINFDTEDVVWVRDNPDKLSANNFMSLVDQTRKWRFFIDIEGVGWSTRLKLFLFSKRVLFLQERPFKEWFFPYMKPWIHYVPVRRDLVDLPEKVQIIKNDRKLEDEIRFSASRFAEQHLTRAAALKRWHHILSSIGRSNKGG